MGTSMTAIVEWTHDARCSLRPELNLPPLGPPRWDDDHLHGVLFETDKEYDFFAAVAGIRNRFDKPPLFPRRGLPALVSSLAHWHLDTFGDDAAGWLHLSEIDAAIAHISASDTFYMDFDLECMLDFMRALISKLTDPHVRLVFNISG
jgi:hypothetical protein